MKNNKFLKLLMQDGISYVSKYFNQIILLFINIDVYIVFAIGESIYNLIYGSIYAISESAKRDTVLKKNINDKNSHISNTIFANLILGITLSIVVIIFRNKIGVLFLSEEELKQLLNIYFLFVIFKCSTIGILRPLYSVGNTEGKIIEIAKINKNRLIYINILLVLLFIINKVLFIENITLLILVLMIYILTEVHQTILTFKIVGRLNIKLMNFKKAFIIIKENYHYLFGMIVYDFSSVFSTYVGSLFGVMGVVISKILYESYKFGSFINSVYTKFLEEQMYIGKLKKLKDFMKKTTITALISSLISLILFVINIKYNKQIIEPTKLNLINCFFVYIVCLSYCLDYSSDILTRISGKVNQLFAISILDLTIKILIIISLTFVNLDMYFTFAIITFGGFISYINAMRIAKKYKKVNLYNDLIKGV